MKSITIHGLNEELDQSLRNKAIEDKTSINKTIKHLLERALGLQNIKQPDHREEFIDLQGVWNEEDETEFLVATKDFSEFREEEWK